MVNSRQGQWLYLLVCGLIVLKTESVSVPITRLESAKAKGAGECFVSFRTNKLIYTETTFYGMGYKPLKLELKTC